MDTSTPLVPGDLDALRARLWRIRMAVKPPSPPPVPPVRIVPTLPPDAIRAQTRELLERMRSRHMDTRREGLG